MKRSEPWTARDRSGCMCNHVTGEFQREATEEDEAGQCIWADELPT